MVVELPDVYNTSTNELVLAQQSDTHRGELSRVALATNATIVCPTFSCKMLSCMLVTAVLSCFLNKCVCVCVYVSLTQIREDVVLALLVISSWIFCFDSGHAGQY